MEAVLACIISCLTTFNSIFSSKYLTLSFLLPKKSVNMLVVLEARPFKSDWMLEKKSLLAPAIAEGATKDVVLLVDSRRSLLNDSP